MASSGQSSEIPRLVSLIKTLTIPQLKDLLRNEGLPLSGLKAALQTRIIDCQYFLSYVFQRCSFVSHFPASIPLRVPAANPRTYPTENCFCDNRTSIDPNCTVASRSRATVPIRREQRPLRCFKEAHTSVRYAWILFIPSNLESTVSIVPNVPTKFIAGSIGSWWLHVTSHKFLRFGLLYGKGICRS